MLDAERPEAGPAGAPPPAARQAHVRTIVFRFPPNGDIVRVMLVVLGLIAIAVLLWQISSVILLAFAAILVAVGLRALAHAIVRLTGLRMGIAVGLAVVVVGLVFAGFSVLLGSQLVAQTRAIVADLPAILDSLGQRLGIENFGPTAFAQIESWFERPGLVDSLLGVTAGIVAVGANLIVAVTAGIYFAFRPETYEGGLLRLLPKAHRARIGRAFGKAGIALNHWLRAQLLAMLLVGVLTSFALFLIGLPSWLALGVIAGLFEFIPYAGPFLAAAPAVLIALSEGGTTVFWVIGAFILVQQLEGSVITPLMQQRVAALPPVVAILSITAMAVAFGPLGVLLAIPAAILVSALVTQLYIRDALHEDV